MTAAKQDILIEISEMRKKDIQGKGHTLGHTVPETRQVPLVPFGRSPFVIGEIKRKSPSKGNIALELDPLEQAARYVKHGTMSISVLTEERYFSGSLSDLMQVKSANPSVAVLRKDFLLDPEDIDVSFRAGADAVLLIATLLPKELLKQMYARTLQCNMAALVEIHTKEDAEKAAAIQPEFVGINSRDLRTFTVDPLLPMMMAHHISWGCRLVYESGVKSFGDAFRIGESGFSGILIGEMAVKRPEVLSQVQEGLRKGRERFSRFSRSFWGRLMKPTPLRHTKGPFIKICGLTKEEDVRLADQLGADLVGFVLADSPRRCSIDFIRSLPPTRAGKVGVVVGDPQDVPTEAIQLVEEGFLDALQFHGDETESELQDLSLPWYKAIRMKTVESAELIDIFSSPRVLVDAFHPDKYGGTGTALSEECVEAAKNKKRLWLAGGIGPNNVVEIIRKYGPELIDVSSSLESGAGIKDHEKMKKFFQEVSGG